MKRNKFVTNRNTNSTYTHTNRVTPREIYSPEVYVDQVWYNEDDIRKGVQIVELKSSEGSERSDIDKNDKVTQKSDHQDSFETGDYATVGGSSGNTQCMNNESQHAQNNSENYGPFVRNEYERKYYSENNYRDSHATSSNEKEYMTSHHVDCVTIIEKNYGDTAENSSEDEFTNIETIHCGESNQDYMWNYANDPDMMAYDAELDVEKRTVWIYSFKNKHLLSDNDFDLVNIQSQDRFTDDSIENFTEINSIDTKVNRSGTPALPAFVVPRLNLTLTNTLPTVTEVCEPLEYKQSSDKLEKSGNDDIINTKPLNSWFLSERATPIDIHTPEDNKQSDIINWMALSPRERKRRFITTSPQSRDVIPLPSLGKEISNNNTPEIASQTRLGAVIEAATVNNMESVRSLTNRLELKEISSARKSATASVAIPTPKLSFSKITMVEIPGEQQEPKDRGDYVNNNRAARPKIRVDRKPIRGSAISDPLEKLDSTYWIIDNNDRGDGKHKCCTNREREIQEEMNKKMFLKSMSLMKASEWEAYLPITESMPSLSLTAISDGVDGNSRSWLKWLCRIWRCCKREF